MRSIASSFLYSSHGTLVFKVTHIMMPRITTVSSKIMKPLTMRPWLPPSPSAFAPIIFEVIVESLTLVETVFIEPLSVKWEFIF